MSVFRLHDWWSVQVSQDEEFDQGCLCLGNLDNARPASTKVALGSLQGMLRVYDPSHPTFRVDDLVLEEQLGQPILQILAGRFIPAANLTALAILHPSKLSVYEITNGGGGGANSSADTAGNKAAFFSLQKCYTHDLGIEGKHFSAFNMTAGLFGGILDREMIIVQSMDGKLQIFEQTAVAFTRQFIDCLVPGPLAYLPRLDAFVTVNHATHAICYRYQVIAGAQTDLGNKSSASRDRDEPSGQAETTGAFGLTAVRSAMVEWDTLLGEHCRQILEGSFSAPSSSSPSSSSSSSSSSSAGGPSGNAKMYRVGEKEPGGEMVLLCDRSMYLVRESGVIVQQRLLERSPACACVYRPAGATGHNFLLANHDGTLQVYSQFQLVWAAKAEKAPVHVAVADFGQQKGLIVMLDDSGRLSLSYLGTRPPLQVASSTGSRELDYNKVEEDHRALLHIIRESQTERKSEPKDKLLIRSQLPRGYDAEPLSSDMALPVGLVSLPYSRAGLVRICVRIFLSYSGSQGFSDVSLSVRGPGFVHVEPQQVQLKSISGARATPTMVKLTFFAHAACLSAGLETEIAASYTSPTGEPRVASHKFLLPMFLACRPKNASKNAAHKLTLDTALPAQSLTELFEDVIYAAVESGQDVSETLGSTAAQAMGFEMWAPASGESAPAQVSILVSKTAGRYRVQSDCLPALCLVMAELERRLITRLSKIEIQPRMKKLLARFKDKNPAPLAGVDVMMRETYARILQLADEAEQLQMLLVRRCCDLSCLSRLLVQVTALRVGMSAAARSLLESYLCVPYHETSGGSEEGSGTGWEETVDGAMTYLLKTVLAKQPKDSGQLSAALEMPSDIEPLKKHIAVVFDRLEKGAQLVLSLDGRGGGGDRPGSKDSREERRESESHK